MTLCGVPKASCNGSIVGLNHGIRGDIIKAHGRAEDAFTCYTKWLVAQGYVRLGKREFQKAPDAPILLLTKPAKFGAALRPVKRRQSVTDRFRPRGNRSGVVLSL